MLLNVALKLRVFFSLVQAIYNFLSGSTSRWKIIQECAREKSLTVKSLSITRWSARADAVTVLNQCFSQILEALTKIENNVDEKPVTRQEAKGIRMQLERLETTLMISLWDFLLKRFDLVNKQLQNVDISINEVIIHYKTLIKIVENTREQFDFYEKKALDMSKIKNYHSELTRVKKRKLHSDETCDDVNLTARDHFKVHTFNVILDRLSKELTDRCLAYETVNEKFAVITEFKDLNDTQIREKARSFRLLFESDLESSFDDEFLYFHAYCAVQKMSKSLPLELLRFIYANDLKTVFPNVEIAYRMFISTAVTNCSAERSFSCLKRIKTYMRSTMNENRLNSLAILCIESEILRTLDCEDIITKFSEAKVRRMCF